MSDTSLKDQLDRIERMLTVLVTGKMKSAWVRSSSIAAMTGWDKEKLRRMRENGVVKVRRVGKRYEYDASSVPPMFIKTPSI